MDSMRRALDNPIGHAIVTRSPAIPVLLVVIFLLASVISLPILYLVFSVGMSRAIRHTDIFPVERAITTAFEELQATGDANRFTFVCLGFDCDELFESES